MFSVPVICASSALDDKAFSAFMVIYSQDVVSSHVFSHFKPS